MGFEQAGVEAVVAGMAAFRKNSTEVNSRIADIAGAARGAEGGIGPLNRVLGTTVSVIGTVAAAAIGAGTALAGLAVTIGGLSVREAIKLESAFAGVIKTTDGLTDASGDLTAAGEEIRQAFRDLAKDVPATVEELMAIGELGGQLGIQRENLIEFTRTIADLGETTNLSTEEAAQGLAQIANIVGTSQEDFDNMGSVIVALGNNFATTERDILNFGQRIAGAGAIAGLTEADIFGIGTAFASVGVEAEAGGTAVQKVLLAMVEAVATGGEGLEAFGEASGVTAKEFADAFAADPAAAFTLFVENLGVKGDEAIGILDELGLTDQRLTRAFLSLAGAGDLLNDSIEMGRTAWEENTALTTEAEARYRTTAAQMEITRNKVRDFAFTIGDSLLPFLNEGLTAIQPWIEELGQRLPGLLEDVVIPAIEDLIAFGGRLVNWFTEDLPAAGEDATDALAPIIDGIMEVAEAFLESMPEIQETFGQAFQYVKDVVDRTMPVLINNIGTALEAIAAFWEDHGAEIMNTIAALWAFVTAIFSSAVALITGVVSGFLALLTGDFEGAKEAILGSLRVLMENALALVGTNMDEFLQVWRNNWEMAKVIVTEIWEGIVRGITEKANELKDKIGQIIQDLIDRVRELLDISSPSGVFREVGISMMDGLIEGLKDGQPDVNQLINEIFDLAGPFARLGSQAARFLKSETVDPIKDQLRDLAEEKADLEEELAGLPDDYTTDPSAFLRRVAIMERLAQIRGQETQLTQELSEAERQLLEFERARQQLAFLEDQQRLLQMIQEHGLDPSEILGGLQLGLDADMGDVLAAMTRAMQQIIQQAEDEMGIASPSKVFAQIGRDMIAGLAAGIDSLVSKPAEAISRATAQAASLVPVTAGAVAGPSSMNQVQFLGSQTFTQPFGKMEFEIMTRRAVMRALKG